MSRGERAECTQCNSEIEIVLYFARLQHDAYYFNERCLLASRYLIEQQAQPRRYDYDDWIFIQKFSLYMNIFILMMHKMHKIFLYTKIFDIFL